MPLVKIKIVEATNLMISDILSSDPYVEIITPTKIFTTQVIKRTLNPVWNEEFYISISNPKMDSVTFVVKDHDHLSEDDPLGKAKILSFASFVLGEDKDLWLNLMESKTEAKLHLIVTPQDFGKNLEP
ncbi:predicted protein [Naegleria gruberi]|uniref:Predicted protein n=1 Tax=Naegleria gruberi TaxID=5762 RepID=D2VJX8_NAEGR|nr:uncharacterized protein NAEGRDRAFT_69198 [Naegleria gruberi]EFC42846.1 predicted protein [Naegleria gruberi]|eukprot:XP_002675590.1 predicted protein [Naegleria gruberi strain NEG-M]